MNRENFNNLIFVLFLVIMIFIAAIVFLVSLKLISLEILIWKVNHYYNLFYSSLLSQIILGLIAALIIILLIYLIWIRGQYSRESLSSVVRKTSFGEIKISTSSLKLLALKVIKGMEEVKEAKAEVNLVKSGGININLHLSVKQGVNIPELSEKIQRRLKEYILGTIGVEAKEIKINIDKIFYEDKEKNN